MSRQPNRLAAGGHIDRSRPLAFRFDGRSYAGFAGDTLASALLANGVLLMGRSFKFHRPRGVFAAGVAEPNALVTLRDGGRREPNIPATMAELYEGLSAVSQNRFPSLGFDLMSVNDRFRPVLAAGFYYKTLMGPRRGSWMWFEPFVRRAAGLGAATELADPDAYEKLDLFCDVLVIGGGPAGLAAALAAGRMGARVILAEQMPSLGGSLLDEPAGGPGDLWLAPVLAELGSLPNVRLLTRTTVFGAYDHGTFGLVERVADHRAAPGPGEPRQRYIVLRAQRAVLAAGALERGIPFADNDRPGVMLASTARGFLNRQAVLPGRQAVVFTNNDGAYPAAFDLARAGARVTVADARPALPAETIRRCAEAGMELLPGHAVAAVHGRSRVRAAVLAPFDASSAATGGPVREIACELVCVSGGWDPQVHLSSQRSVKPIWRDDIAAFVPGPPPAFQIHAGACRGSFATGDSITDGFRAGRDAAASCGRTRDPGSVGDIGESLGDAWATPIAPVWDVKPLNRSGKRFVDLQNDVSVSDVELAHREGYVSVEHLKRYTTLGMATDQGKTANVVALALMARLSGRSVPETGTTTYRPPYTPVAIGALAAAETGRNFRPIRRTPLHAWHERNGAVFTEAGLWLRPWYYPQPGEDVDAAYRREMAAVRRSVGMVDISTLGKIDVQGPDAGAFLDRVYVNGFASLPVGKARYGIMLREDGLILDDGTTARLSEQHFFMTTTTAEAAKVLAHLEWLLQAAWPELRVHVASVTDQWAAMAVSGPNSRKLIAAAGADTDLSNEALPHLGVRPCRIGGLPARLHRLSFSGELAYEIYTPAGFGEAVWQRLVDAGEPFGLVPYGVEALAALRIEKGHVAGSEIDGRTTLDDLGLGRMASRRKPFVGGVLRHREALLDEDRLQLVGLEPVDGTRRLRGGAILQPHGGPHRGHGLGHVTATTYSPERGHYVALALVTGGMRREGELLDACFPLNDEITPVRVIAPRFIDPEGRRLDG
ncbi:MAG: sarcosine oxidase subunit alpha [Alphaproteobacteria bacterium]|nr:MAG: sarcosine oxidase subunit alpha [Alphaproteobacteria bacterium]